MTVLIVFLVFIALIAFASCLVLPKTSAIILVITVFASNTIAILIPYSALGYLDEFAVVLALLAFPVRRLFARKALRIVPGTSWLVAYVAVGTLSGVVLGAPIATMMASTFLVLKAFLFAFALAQLDWNPNDLRRGVKLCVVVTLIVLAAALVNFLLPEFWTQLLSRRGRVDYRFGFASLIGPFDHEVAFGQFMVIAFLAILAYRIAVKRTGWSLALLWATALGAVLSFRRKSLTALLGASAFVVLFGNRKRTTGTVISLLLGLPLLVVIGWDAITSVADSVETEYFSGIVSAREVMTRDSFALAFQHFPLGVGFGRFGTSEASRLYSPIYVELGYPAIYGLGQGDMGGYLTDTFWPGIIAESGFLGAGFFAFALIAITRRAFIVSRDASNPYIHWIALVVFAWSIEFALESIAAPVYSSPPLFGLFSAALALLIALTHPDNEQPRSELGRSKQYVS